MIEVNDYVVEKGTEHPTGIVEMIEGNLASVRWGVADKRTYRNILSIDSLDKVDHAILSSDDITKLKVSDDGKVYLKTED